MPLMDWFANTASAGFWLLAWIALMLAIGALALLARYLALRDETRIDREFFRSTFDAAAVGMAVADVDGRYIRVNRAMCDYVGYSEEELLRMSYHDITHPDDLAANVQARQRMLAGEMPTFQMEKRYVRKDGRAVWALMVVSEVVDSKGRLIYSVGQMLDIDARKQVEQQLRSSQESLLNAQRMAKMGEWEWSLSEDLLRCSEQVGDVLGIESAGLPVTVDGFIRLLHPDDQGIAQCALNQALADGSSFAIDIRLAGLPEAPRYICVRGEVLVDSAGQPVHLHGTCQDVTERELTKQILRESQKLLRERSTHQEILLEKERKRISREIHDELGQRLTALKMDISLLRLRFGKNPELLGKLEEMRATAEDTIDVVRHIASALRPAPLDLGLTPAIEWLARDLERHTDVCCRLDLGDEEVAVDDDLATAVFRVIQESLTNVARHANATEVRISLRCRPGCLWVQVQDDGCGFDPEPAGQTGSFGLLGMRERVLGLGGRLLIESGKDGQGSVISLEIPLLDAGAR